MSSFIFNMDKLAQALGLEHLPRDRQEEFLGRLEKIISSRIHVAVLEKLSETEQAEFLALVEKEQDDKAATYIKAKVADLDELVKTISAETIDEFVRRRDKVQ